MSIDFHLANFPQLNQNKEDPGHQYPDVNAGMDCVPTSIAAALTWFTGTQYYGDELIDAVYGSSYTGGTAAANYENYCAQRGVSLFPVDGSPQQLVQAIHSQLHQNRPVLVTVPGHWNDPATSGANPGNVTHVMVVCGDGPGSIQVMNPWNGQFEEYSDSWFAVKLCYGQIWPMEGAALIPKGPFYSVTAGQNGVPTSLNGVAAAMGLSVADLLAIPGQNPELQKYDPSGPYLVGPGTYAVSFLLPGFPAPAASAPAPTNDPKADAAKAALKAWLAE